MRYILIAAAFVSAGTPSFAAQPVITENLAGTISGSHTVDTKGYFGTAGADLKGAKVSIYLQYVPSLLGASQECRNHACTYNESQSMRDTPGSLVVTATINGSRVVYAPVQEAAIFFNTNAPYQLTVDSDAFSGFGLGSPGLQLATQFTMAPVFGQALSPRNEPVLKESSSDYLNFYDASSQTPVEQLTYTPSGGTR